MFSNNHSGSQPNPDVFKTHFGRATEACKAGKYDEAQVHFVEAAEVMDRLVKATHVPDIRKLREQMLVEIIEMATLCGEAPKTNGRSPVIPAKDASRPSGPKAADESSSLVVSNLLVKGHVTFADVIGHTLAKEQLQNRMINPFRDPEINKAFKISAGGAMLLFGPPGTGKTLLAKAAASEIDADCYVVSASDLLSKWYGEAEKNVRDLFDGIRKASKRAILFLDEADSLLGDSSRSGGTPEERVLSQFLVGLEGAHLPKQADDSGLFFMAATNKPWNINMGMIGRFRGNVIYTALPTEEDRVRILQSKLVDIPLADDVEIPRIANLTPGYAGRDLEAICDNVRFAAHGGSLAQGRIVSVTQAMFQTQLERVRPTSSPEQIKRFEEWCASHGAPSS